MSFHYTKPPLTQGLTGLALLGAGLGLMALPGAEAAWAGWLADTPSWLHVFVVVSAFHGLVFWGMTAAFGVVDRTDRPAFIARYRIQTGTVRRPPLGRTLRVLALNQLVLSPLMLLGLWGVLDLRGWAPQPTLPGAVEVLLDLSMLTVISAVWFYASHRFLHRPWWMKRVHKVHHEFRSTTCMAAEYAHPVEMVFANFGTLAVGVALVAPHLATLYLYTVLATVTFVGHHSGYAVPWMSWAVHHDWHHYRTKEAFGTFGLIDRALGTDAEFHTLEHGQEVGGPRRVDGAPPAA